MRPALFLCLLLALVAPLAAKPVTLPAIREHLVRWEGYRLTPYRDGDGWSVGVGHSITWNGERRKARYSSAEVERYLLTDIAWALDCCRQGVHAFDDLPEAAQLVAIGVAFTVGRTGFGRFVSFRAALSRRAYGPAARHLIQSRWAGQVSADRRDSYVNTLDSLP